MFSKKPHELRIQVVNPAGMTPDDEAFVELLTKYPPRTELKSGDLCRLMAIPSHLIDQGPFPNIWEVRAVYSLWQFWMHRLVHQTGGMFDWAITQIEVARRLPPTRYREPVVYAHAFPHGEWPSSAEWLPGDCVQKLVLAAPTQEWEPILNEFSTPFLGYDQKAGVGVYFDLAPDIYADQRNRTRPLSFEEGAFHRACLLGLEEDCMVPATTETFNPSYESELYDIWGDGSTE